MTETTATNPSFEAIALSQGIVSPEMVEEARQIQKKVETAGLHEGIDEILVKKGFITQQQRAAILAIMGKGGKTSIPGYEILSKLGQGGMGAVYKARQLSMDRLVAIKVLLPSFAKEGDAVDRFTREARTIAKLNHPNIVGGIDAGHAGGIYFYAMEFIEGDGLDKILKKRGRLPWREATKIVRQVAEGLNHATRLGIVHRDIKPANIMVVKDGSVKILDLGLARLSTGDQFHTQAGQVLGTPAYISPEQARGEQDIDMRSDLYSLGIMFFEMLNGKPPFRGDSILAVVAQHVNDRVKFAVSPESVDVPAALPAVGTRMTMREREKRYQTPQELIEDLDALTAGRALPNAKALGPAKAQTVRRAPPVEAPPRSKTPAIVGGLVAVIVLAVAAYFMMKGGGGPPPPAPVSPDKPAADPYADALKELADARSFEASHPGDLDAAVLRYEAVLPKLPDDEQARLKPRLAELKQTRDARAGLAQVKADAQAAFKKLSYGAAVAALEAARGRFAAGEWTEAIDKEISAYKLNGSKEARAVHQKADELERLGNKTGAIEALEAILPFCLPDLVEEAQTRIDGIRRSLAGTEQLLEADRNAWESLLARVLPAAFVREYDAARSQVSAATDTFKTERYQKDVEALNDDLQKASAVAKKAEDGAEKIARGEEMDFVYRRPDGTVEYVRGKVGKKAGTTIEIDGTFYKAYSPDGWFAGSDALKLAGRTGEIDAEAAGLFLLFEREGKAAEAKLGAVPPRYLAVLSELKRIESEAEASREKNAIAAGAMFEEAERLFKEKKIGEAASRYRTLLREYAATDVVKANQKQIRARAAPAGPEIVLYASDAARADVHGLWKSAAADKAADKTVLTTDDHGMEGSPVEKSTDTVDFFFYAEPDVDYRLWMRQILPAARGASNKVWVQFSDAVGADGKPVYRLGTAGALALQYWAGTGTKDWGWTDRDMLASGSQGPTLRFKSGGLKTVRVLLGEDGTAFDQVLLTTKTYLSAPPAQTIVKKP